MTLECLIVTCDPTLIGHVQASLGTHGASLELRQDSASAIELASRRHLDGLVIDCDDVPGGAKALAQVRSSSANKQTLMVAVVNGSTSVEVALDLGASFVLSKPIQQSRLRSILAIGVPRMEREHRRYFRYDVDLSARLGNPLGHSLTAKIMNVSEGGLAIKLVAPAKFDGVVTLEFELPSVEPKTFHAKADVVWHDAFVVGLRFLYIEKDSRIALQTWLNSLAAQLPCREMPRSTF
jgi:CheY-like chemotaxis protein